jgi:hypothetical protein
MTLHVLSLHTINATFTFIKRLGSYQVANYKTGFVCFQRAVVSTFFARRLYSRTLLLGPSPPQHRTALSKRAQAFFIRVQTCHFIDIIKMAQKDEKPVFFFDIDNCVRQCVLVHQVQLADFEIALPKECAATIY